MEGRSSKPHKDMKLPERNLRDLRDKLILLRSKISDIEEPEKDEILKSISEVLTVMDEMLIDPKHLDFAKLFLRKTTVEHRLKVTKKKFPNLGQHCSEVEKFLIRIDFIYLNNQEIQNALIEFSDLSYKLKNLCQRQISDDDVKDFQKMSEIMIKYSMELKDPCSKIDHILYKDGMLPVDATEKNNTFEIHAAYACNMNDILCAYYHTVIVKNTVNQYLDNAFLKLVECRAMIETWHLDGLILKLLESKIMYQICIGLKIFKTYFNAGGFKCLIGRDLCYAMSDLSKILNFVEWDENEMARFVDEQAKECHELIKEESLPQAYRADDIFMEIKKGKVIGQYEIRALYEIMKSGKSSEIINALRGCGISSVVHLFLYYIKRFYTKYEELDEEMREMDKDNGQGFGGFLLEIVTDVDMKKPLCASDGLEKSTLNKYFFYDDAMKTLSMLSFLYCCIEKCFKNICKGQLQKFKVKSYVTQFVTTLIHQYDQKNKIDKPIWIMEKILMTCHFVVFGHDEEKEKDIFLRLMDGKQIDEEDLSCLKNFIKKNNLSYEDIDCDYEYHNE